MTYIFKRLTTTVHPHIWGLHDCVSTHYYLSREPHLNKGLNRDDYRVIVASSDEEAFSLLNELVAGGA